MKRAKTISVKNVGIEFGLAIAYTDGMTTTIRLITLSCWLPLAGASLFANTVQERLQDSAGVMQEILAAPDRGIPTNLLAKSSCVVIVPGLKKAAFIIGAKYGRGFVICRHDNLAGWGAPAAIRIEGGSFGLQIGASETDVVMLIMNKPGMRKLLQSKFTVGGAAEVAAGPVGRSSTAQTDAEMSAKILSWSRSRGVFAGVSLQGATLRQDSDENQRLYHHQYSNKDIVFKKIAAPREAGELLAVLNHHSARP